MNILAIDVGGTWIKVLLSGQKEVRKIASSPTLTPMQMVDAVKKVAADWKYDAISASPQLCRVRFSTAWRNT